MQWLHEEKLILPDSSYPWVGMQRSVILTTIKKVSTSHIIVIPGLLTVFQITLYNSESWEFNEDEANNQQYIQLD